MHTSKQDYTHTHARTHTPLEMLSQAGLYHMLYLAHCADCHPGGDRSHTGHSLEEVEVYISIFLV